MTHYDVKLLRPMTFGDKKEPTGATVSLEKPVARAMVKSGKAEWPNGDPDKAIATPPVGKTDRGSPDQAKTSDGD